MSFPAIHSWASKSSGSSRSSAVNRGRIQAGGVSSRDDKIIKTAIDYQKSHKYPIYEQIREPYKIQPAGKRRVGVRVASPSTGPRDQALNRALVVPEIIESTPIENSFLRGEEEPDEPPRAVSP